MRCSPGWRPGSESAMRVGRKHRLPRRPPLASRPGSENSRPPENPNSGWSPRRCRPCLRYSMPGILPVGVQDPSVSFDGDRMRIQARVLPARIPDPAPAGRTSRRPARYRRCRRAGFTRAARRSWFDAARRGHRGAGMAAFRPERSRRFSRRWGTSPRRARRASALVVPAMRGLRGAYIEDGKLVVVRA